MSNFNAVEAFEREVCSYTGVENAIAVNNGSNALIIGLEALGIPRGSYVITTPFTYPATAEGIIHAGGKPLFVDVDPVTYLIDPTCIAEAIKEFENISAVLPVHLFGKICELKLIRLLAKTNNLLVLEDCSQAFGCRDDCNNHVGTTTDGGTFSFYATKNLSTYEGGMFITNNHYAARNAKVIRNHGWQGGDVVLLGRNAKMPRILAYHGWTTLRLHKKAIESELGSYGLNEGYYPRVVYDYTFYKEYPELWDKMPCPVAEELAEKVRGMIE